MSHLGPKTTAIAKDAWGLRQTGMTYKEIGGQLGCSVERARQLVVKHAYFVENFKAGTVHELPVRAQNALRNMRFQEGGEDGEHWPFSPAFVAMHVDYSSLIRIENLGNTSIAAIANWLSEHGYALRGYGDAASVVRARDRPRCKCCGQILPVDTKTRRR